MSVSRLLTSINTLWVLIALMVPFLVAATNPLQDDIWWTLKLGELLAAGRDLRQEVLTFPPHAEGYVNAQWLTQLWYHAVHQLLGLEGIPLVNAIQVTAAFALVLDLARRRSGDIRVAALCSMAGAVIAATNFNPRAQTLAILFFAATAWLLQTPGRPGPRLTALAVVASLWANVHGSFWLGPALAVLLLTHRRTCFLALAVFVQCIGTLVNPNGVDIYRYVIAVVANPVVRGAITEWQPPTLADVSGAAFYCSLLATTVLVLRSRRRLEALTLLFFAALGLIAVRNIAWWGIVAAPVWASYVTVPQRRPSSGRPGLNIALVSAMLMFALFSIPWSKGLNPLLPASRRALVSSDLPEGAAGYLATEGPGGHVFSFQPWGGYLEWRLWPRHQLLVDGRIELRPSEVWEDYARISAGDATWQRRLEKHEIQVLVLNIDAQPTLISAVRESPAWASIYGDSVAVIYVKK